jgi:lysophospholipase L1-like esterase
MMPAEQDERLRQLEALRRYVSNLGVTGDQPTAGGERPPPRLPPVLSGWALLALAAVAATALVGGILAARTLGPDMSAGAISPATPSVVVVGDSLSTVTAPAGPTIAFPLVAARLLGWQAILQAQPGTGFASPAGPDARRPSLTGAVGEVVARDPQVVIVALGSDEAEQADRAHVTQSAVTVQAAATRALADLRRRLSRASIVVVGPLPSAGAPPPALQAVRGAVRAAAQGAHVRFIDPIAEGWITGDRADRWSGNAAQMISADGWHLTPAGHAYVGLRLASDLSGLTVASP